MRDEDYRQEYLGEPYEYDVHHTIIIRAITQIEGCASCPNSLICVTGRPLAEGSNLARTRRTRFLCSRCACFHMWWPEQRMHIICGLLRLGTHAQSQQKFPSGIDHAMVALWGSNADIEKHTANTADGEAPCANFWNDYDLIVPMHPLTDGHPKYNDKQDRRSYQRCVDEYDCIDYFAGRVPREFMGVPREGRFRERFAPTSPFTVRR